jgi:hypothetical protein
MGDDLDHAWARAVYVQMFARATRGLGQRFLAWVGHLVSRWASNRDTSRAEGSYPMPKIVTYE